MISFNYIQLKDKEAFSSAAIAANEDGSLYFTLQNISAKISQSFAPHSIDFDYDAFIIVEGDANNSPLLITHGKVIEITGGNNYESLLSALNSKADADVVEQIQNQLEAIGDISTIAFKVFRTPQDVTGVVEGDGVITTHDVTLGNPVTKLQIQTIGEYIRSNPGYIDAQCVYNGSNSPAYGLFVDWFSLKEAFGNAQSILIVATSECPIAQHYGICENDYDIINENTVWDSVTYNNGIYTAQVTFNAEDIDFSEHDYWFEPLLDISSAEIDYNNASVTMSEDYYDLLCLRTTVQPSIFGPNVKAYVYTNQLKQIAFQEDVNQVSEDLLSFESTTEGELAKRFKEATDGIGGTNEICNFLEVPNPVPYALYKKKYNIGTKFVAENGTGSGLDLEFLRDSTYPEHYEIANIFPEQLSEEELTLGNGTIANWYMCNSGRFSTTTSDYIAYGTSNKPKICAWIVTWLYWLYDAGIISHFKYVSGNKVYRLCLAQPLVQGGVGLYPIASDTNPDDLLNPWLTNIIEADKQIEGGYIHSIGGKSGTLSQLFENADAGLILIAEYPDGTTDDPSAEYHIYNEEEESVWYHNGTSWKNLSEFTQIVRNECKQHNLELKSYTDESIRKINLELPGYATASALSELQEDVQELQERPLVKWCSESEIDLINDNSLYNVGYNDMLTVSYTIALELAKHGTYPAYEGTYISSIEQAVQELQETYPSIEGYDASRSGDSTIRLFVVRNNQWNYFTLEDRPDLWDSIYGIFRFPINYDFTQYISTFPNNGDSYDAVVLDDIPIEDYTVIDKPDYTNDRTQTDLYIQRGYCYVIMWTWETDTAIKFALHNGECLYSRCKGVDCIKVVDKDTYFEYSDFSAKLDGQSIVLTSYQEGLSIRFTDDKEQAFIVLYKKDTNNNIVGWFVSCDQYNKHAVVPEIHLTTLARIENISDFQQYLHDHSSNAFSQYNQIKWCMRKVFDIPQYLIQNAKVTPWKTTCFTEYQLTYNFIATPVFQQGETVNGDGYESGYDHYFTVNINDENGNEIYDFRSFATGVNNVSQSNFVMIVVNGTNLYEQTIYIPAGSMLSITEGDSPILYVNEIPTDFTDKDTIMCIQNNTVVFAQIDTQQA